MASTWTVNQLVKITKTQVDRLRPPERGQAFLRDRELKGFAVRVTANGVKSFILEKRIDGRTRRMTLGRYPELTAEQARREAQKQLGQIATGVDPVAEAQQRERLRTTLQEAFNDYKKTRKNLRPRTLYDYERLLEVAFSDWKRRALVSISKDMVAKRHQKLGTERGPAYANLAMRFLRALFNFAIATYEDRNGVPMLPFNPVDRLNQTRAWYRVERRRTVIRPHQLPAWYRAVLDLRSEDRNEPGSVVADYLLLLLFTGLRREEGARLRWEEVDLAHRTLLVRDTKNHEPLLLPLPAFLCDLLEQRRRVAVNDYVFPGRYGSGRLQEPRPQMRKVIEQSGVEFTIHDLRRTFITLAESLDISAYALKRLVNHKMHHDVTAGYIISDIERLRGPMDRISAALLQAIAITEGEPLEQPATADP